MIESNNMKIEINQTTLIDQVEDSLLTYFKKNDLRRGDSIPNENNLAAELGVARSVVREALSRLKMMGLIHARPRKGMVLTEPSILGGMKRVIDPRVLSEETILDLLDFRIALEIGISSDIFRKITPKDIEELSEIVKMGIVFENNEYALISESAFHTKLYKITGNKITFANMSDNIDIDASPVIYGPQTLKELGEEFLQELVEVANGKQTKAETLGYTEMAIARLCNYV